MASKTVIKSAKKDSLSSRIKVDFRRYKELYFILIPVIAFYAIFHYAPMYGAIIAFKDFSPGLGIWASKWVGFEHFIDFFSSRYFWRLMTNTLSISFTNLLFGFPAPILLALFVNELKSKRFARLVQTVTYMPHFISIVVVCGMIHQFTKDTGFITTALTYFGFEKQTMLSSQGLFTPIYVISAIWQELGWGSIIYLAALTGIDQQLYEAARIDGANKFRQIWHVSIPGLVPTIIVLLIMRVGRIMNIGYEKIILLYNPGIYESADVISTYVYRIGLQNGDWSYSTAVGLFNSVIGFILVVSLNAVSRATTDNSLW